MEEEVKKARQRFGIVGNAPALTRAIERAVKVAPIDLSVLVTGESGTGKEFFPQIIHQYGARKHKKYIAVNCGAIPEGTIDSELFGHEKGSFTGAISSRKGYFEEADGGTIFLDEVAELPLTTQARLLRVLETGQFLKVGSSEVQTTDIRVVAATNVDLQEAVRKGKFREDLYYRLSTVVIDVPPLSERGEDIVLLARKFASDFSRKYMTAPITFSEGARRVMMLYRWPGNVRQLKNVVEQLALFEAGKEIERDEMMEALPSSGDSSIIKKEDGEISYSSERQILWQMLMQLRMEVDELRRGSIPTEDRGNLGRLLPAPPGLYGASTEAEKKNDDIPEGGSLVEAEKEAVQNALSRHGGNKTKAAEELGISLRTLYRKIHELGI